MKTIPFSKIRVGRTYRLQAYSDHIDYVVRVDGKGKKNADGRPFISSSLWTPWKYRKYGAVKAAGHFDELRRIRPTGFRLTPKLT